MSHTSIVRIKLMSEDVRPPQRASKYAAGFDLHAHIQRPVIIAPGESMIVYTGIMIEFPQHDTAWLWTAQVCSRSGLAAKHNVFVLNSPGIIDEDYRGEIKVILMNAGNEPYMIHPHDRIAQLIINRTPQVSLEEVDVLTHTDRGEGGLGSTGV